MEKDFYIKNFIRSAAYVKKPTMSQIILRAYDHMTDKMVYSTDEGAEFLLKNGKWQVTYITEINTMNGDIEMDVPVSKEIDEPEVIVCRKHN